MVSDSLATLRGRIGGLALAAQRDPREYTAQARATFMGRFTREVDPDGVLPPVERARRAEAARRLYFQRLALASAKARQKKSRPVGRTARATATPQEDDSRGTHYDTR